MRTHGKPRKADAVVTKGQWDRSRLISAMAVAISESCATNSPILGLNEEGGPSIDLYRLAGAIIPKSTEE